MGVCDVHEFVPQGSGTCVVNQALYRESRTLVFSGRENKHAMSSYRYSNQMRTNLFGSD